MEDVDATLTRAQPEDSAVMVNCARTISLVDREQLGRIQSRRSRIALATASARLDAPSLRIAFPICHLTVTAEIRRASAISAEVFPLATRRRVSVSRGVRAIERPYPKVQDDRTSHSVSNRTKR